MKKKQLIISLSLALTIITSLLFQSLHSYEHVVKQLSEKVCVHEHNNYNHTELTHHHHNFDVCAVCHFTFSSYVKPQTVVFQVVHFSNEIPYFFTASATVTFFSGSLYSHRGPPVV